LEISRTRLKRAIESSVVLVNGSSVSPHYRVRTGDEIRVGVIEAKSPPTTLPEDIPLDIVYEDESLLIVDKPAGMVVHPAPGHFTGTLFNALLYHLRDETATGKAEPGLVHRLDRDTSGLLLVAKNADVKEILSEQIRERKIDRRYRTLVWGHLRESEGTIEEGIGRHPSDRKKMSVHASKKRHALTEYRVLERFPVCDHAAVRLGTGRTHQIRVHFSSVGHPVVGDGTYGGGKGRETGFTGEGRKQARHILSLIDRQALHAYRLSFTHPATGERMSFTSPVPDDIGTVLSFLGSRYRDDDSEGEASSS
jgi:23S rRNA pseudouridine1911/1915/1917 synthase